MKDLRNSKKGKAAAGRDNTIEWLDNHFLPCFQTFNCENLAARFPSHGVALGDTGEEESNQVEDAWMSNFKVYGGTSWKIDLNRN